MADNEFVGSSAYAQWIGGTSGSTPGTVTLHTESRNMTYTPSIEFIDATAGADTTRRRLPSFKDATLAISVLAQTSDGTIAASLLNYCFEGAIGTMTFGEAGSAAGRAKITMPSYSQGVTKNVPYGDVVSYDLSFLVNGAATAGTF